MALLSPVLTEPCLCQKCGDNHGQAESKMNKNTVEVPLINAEGKKTAENHHWANTTVVNVANKIR